MDAQFKRYFLGGSAQFVSAFAAEVVTLAPPTLASTRAHAVNVATGQVYYAKNANTTDTIPASTTKMMTCYTLLQHKTHAELENTVTVIAADLQAGSGANLLAGDVISYRQLIADAMLPSSNAACAVIARSIGQMLLDIEAGGVGDSFARFMAEMNTVSDAIGMTASTWYNPSGLNGPDYTPPTDTNITTPSDMNRVMGLLWAYPVMAQVWLGGAQFYDMPLTRSGSPTSIQIENVHGLRADAGVIGGKTGTTTVANSCALWQAPSGDVIAVTVFNGGVDGRYTDSRAIFTQLPLDFPELGVASTLKTFAASAAAQAASTADISKGVSLAAATLSIATGTAGMSLAVPLVATATGQASANGQIALSVTFAADALSSALATADITVGKSLDAAATGQATGGATLSLAINLTAAAVSQATAEASFNGAVSLAASAIANAQASAALAVGKPLDAVAQAQASAGAALWLDVSLSAAALAQAVAAGALNLTVNLAAASVSNASAGAILPSEILLSADGVAVSTASAALTAGGTHRTYPLASATQAYQLAAIMQAYPLAGQTQHFPLEGLA